MDIIIKNYSLKTIIYWGWLHMLENLLDVPM